MRRLIFILLFSFAAIFSAQAQQVSVVKFDALESLLSKKSDKLLVINFWATWCGPCVKEMPYFETALDTYEEDMELYFISLDYADQIEKVKNFVSKKSLDAKVMILDELDYNSWIDRVDPSWSGAIPQTNLHRKRSDPGRNYQAHYYIYQLTHPS